MRAIEIKPGIMVVAQGKLGVVVRCTAADKVEILLSSSNKTISCDVYDVECIDPNYDPNNNPVTIENTGRGDVSEQELELATLRFGIIKRYCDNEITRTEAIELLAVSNGTFYKLKNLYDEETGPASLTRFPRGRQSGFRQISQVLESLIEEAIKIAWKGRAASIASVWRKLNEICVEQGEITPSKKTVAARLNGISDRERYALKYGAEAAEQKYGSRPGRRNTARPLEIVQMDHTLVDLIIVSENDRQPLGRPWLTILIDNHTRVIIGYYLALHAPSTVSVSCAVTHTVLPKKQFLERLQRTEIKYPFYGIPEILHMDNAKEFKTAGFQKACDKHKIKPEWRPYGRKHYGGHIERLIGTMMGRVHFLPGTTMSNTQQRKGIDSEKKSAMTFKEFCRWFAGEVALYHETKHSSLDGSPSQEWDKFFIGSHSSPRLPALISNPHQFRLDFMSEKFRCIGNRGIQINGLLYWSPLLSLYVGGKKVRVKYDPFSIKCVWVFLNQEYIQVPLSDSTQEDMTLAELKHKNKLRANGSLDRNELIAISQANELIVKDSIRETKRKRKQKVAVNEYREAHSIKTPLSNIPSVREKPDYTQKAVPFKRESK